MKTVEEIKRAISRLPLEEVGMIKEWLTQWLEDQQSVIPEFLASIERGKEDIAAGRTRTVRP